jgi:hypothetical protein
MSTAPQLWLLITLKNEMPRVKKKATYSHTLKAAVNFLDRYIPEECINIKRIGSYLSSVSIRNAYQFGKTLAINSLSPYYRCLVVGGLAE